MTTFDRFEREIPDLMVELAPPRVPDYFDDMLRQSARTRQRPAWSALERWLPMGVIARTQPMRPLPWRMIAIAVALLLLACATLLYAGSRPRVPEPFGPARNGQIIFSADGEIVAVDPRTGTSTTLITGPETDTDPWFTNDGTTFAFDRLIGGEPSLFIANSDGSGVRQLLPPAAQIDWFEWSPDGRRFILSRVGDQQGVITIVNATNGSMTTFKLDMDVFGTFWRPNSDQLIVTGEESSPSGVRTHGFYLVGSDGTGLRPIVVSTTAINDGTVSPDGSLLAYTVWESGAEGRTHIIDIDTGIERAVDFAPDVDFVDLSPIFSPDGTRIVVHRSTDEGYRLTVLPVDGRGPAVPMGAVHPDMTDGARVVFSPDGTKVLATYQDDGTTWLLDVATGAAEPTTWSIPMNATGSWQRLAL